LGGYKRDKLLLKKKREVGNRPIEKRERKRKISRREEENGLRGFIYASLKKVKTEALIKGAKSKWEPETECSDGWGKKIKNRVVG